MANCSKITVLRLKRKACEDPLQKILVQCPGAKRAKTVQENSKDRFIFQLIETKNEGLDNGDILNQLEKQFSSSQDLIDNERRKCTEVKADNTSSMQCASRLPKVQNYEVMSKSSYPQWRIQNSAKDNEMRTDDLCLEIIEVSKNDDIGRRKFSSENVKSSEILCNSIKMIQENLKIADDCAIQDAEYVYDLYYSQAEDLDELNHVISIQSYDDEELLYYPRFDENTEKYSSEDDDSNDENHWKNDYPDEDEYFSSEDGETDDESASNGSDFSDRQQYRLRNVHWNFYEDGNNEQLYNFEAYDDESSQEYENEIHTS